MTDGKTEFTEAEASVLTGMGLLGATNVPHSAYQNVKDGEEAWHVLVACEYIVMDEGFWVLSEKGIEALMEIHNG